MTGVADELQVSSGPSGADPAIGRAVHALLKSQQKDGHWVFELEADATIPAEYVLLRHYRGEPRDAGLEQKIAVYLRRIQGTHGGWPLYHDGDFDMSASVKAYFALKMVGDRPDAPHMRRAREAILARGGAVNSNVFTRVLLSLYGILDLAQRAGNAGRNHAAAAVVSVPSVESVLLGAYSAGPLLVLQALLVRALKNPLGIKIDELFVEPPHSIGPAAKAPHQSWLWFALFRCIDVILRPAVKVFPQSLRQRAIDRAVDFVTERLNGEDGLGAIFPAMANAAMMFDALDQKEKAAVARGSIEKLLVVGADEAYCQPCVSPVWDTGPRMPCIPGNRRRRGGCHGCPGLDWLRPRQVLEVAGDWINRRPDVRPGGWAFQYANPHYPDLDDTAVVVMAMDRARRAGAGSRYDAAIDRGVEWIKGMQSRNGGWAAFDVDNVFHYLNNIPFADHGALIDPPTEDVTARCVSMLAQLGETVDDSEALSRGVAYLRETQLADGSWYGRWGLNYIYGTWSTLCALNACGVDRSSAEIRKAVDWLVSIQNDDGGWGEDGSSYKLDYRGHEPAASTSSQTAWALLGLMAVGEIGHPAVQRGVYYLSRTQTADGLWDEERYTATGFPRVFYLRYHGYRKFFPLWALARYRNLKASNTTAVTFGM